VRWTWIYWNEFLKRAGLNQREDSRSELSWISEGNHMTKGLQLIESNHWKAVLWFSNSSLAALVKLSLDKLRRVSNLQLPIETRILMKNPRKSIKPWNFEIQMKPSKSYSRSSLVKRNNRAMDRLGTILCIESNLCHFSVRFRISLIKHTRRCSNLLITSFPMTLKIHRFHSTNRLKLPATQKLCNISPFTIWFVTLFLSSLSHSKANCVSYFVSKHCKTHWNWLWCMRHETSCHDFERWSTFGVEKFNDSTKFISRFSLSQNFLI
jgi:hypothetical protein